MKYPAVTTPARTVWWWCPIDRWVVHYQCHPEAKSGTELPPSFPPQLPPAAPSRWTPYFP